MLTGLSDLNDPGDLERRYVELAVEGVGLFGDDPARVRRHIEGQLAQWSEGDRFRLRQLLALKAGLPPSGSADARTLS
ncbi:hypothetical protein NS226_18160 [Aureimonas ureilytica]|uniref:Uncharacterized protein n=1 Tax=Aureimonas ureilytica TaxID=401562 RepID=A0A175R5B5_9HYPH|nr:hypothetical protein NS226_18160 [Aureimonas ureilytica]